MLNDATCFKAVYIVCGYTDLRSGMDRLAHWWKRGRETGLTCLIPFTFSAGVVQTVSKDWHGKGTDGSCYIRDCQKAVFNGRAARRKYVP